MKARVGLGTTQFAFSEPRRYWAWVELLEAQGVDSLWQSDRLVSKQPHLAPVAAIRRARGSTSAWASRSSS